MSEYTDEPLVAVIDPKSGCSNLSAGIIDIGVIYSPAEARRIVLTTNACAGIASADLERVKDDATPVFELLMQATKQRDDLLAAMDEIASPANVENTEAQWRIKKAKAAVASVRKANGKCYYAPDGTLMNPDGTRSIFDDVDQ